jgi:hypothetical protein
MSGECDDPKCEICREIYGPHPKESEVRYTNCVSEGVEQSALQVILARPGCAEEVRAYDYETRDFVRPVDFDAIHPAVWPTLHVMTKADAALNSLAAEVLRLEGELDEARDYSVCIFCGAQLAKDLNTMLDHAAVCGNRPEKRLLARIAELEGERDKAVKSRDIWAAAEVRAHNKLMRARGRITDEHVYDVAAFLGAHGLDISRRYSEHQAEQKGEKT